MGVLGIDLNVSVIDNLRFLNLFSMRFVVLSPNNGRFLSSGEELLGLVMSVGLSVGPWKILTILTSRFRKSSQHSK